LYIFTKRKLYNDILCEMYAFAQDIVIFMYIKTKKLGAIKLMLRIKMEKV